MQLTLVLFMLVHSYFFCVLKLNDNQPYIVEPGRAKKENNRADQTTDHRPQTRLCPISPRFGSRSYGKIA